MAVQMKDEHVWKTSLAVADCWHGTSVVNRGLREPPGRAIRAPDAEMMSKQRAE